MTRTKAAISAAPGRTASDASPGAEVDTTHSEVSENAHACTPASSHRANEGLAEELDRSAVASGSSGAPLPLVDQPRLFSLNTKMPELCGDPIPFVVCALWDMFNDELLASRFHSK
jgi:hypothetical protein